jgi:uncharacterized membrane protein affecting hemolysin expression
MASWNGHVGIVRTLLEYGADVEAKNNVRNQMMMVMMMMMMMMMITIIIVLTIMMLMSMINDEDRGDKGY